MFFPQEMTEMELIVPEKELLSVTNLLARQGVFHQVDASYMSSRAKVEEGDSWKDRASAYATLERQIGLLMQALEVDEGTPPKAEEGALAELESVRPRVEQIEGEVRGSNNNLTASQKSLDGLQNSIHELEPIADVEIDMGQLHHSRYIYSILGTMPAANLQRLETSLGRIPHVLTKLREDRETAVVWLTGPRGNSDILERAARSAYLDPLVLSGDYHGTPAEIIKSLNDSVNSTQAEIQKEKSSLQQFSAKYGDQLRSSLWSVRASRMLADAMAHFGRLQHTYLIVGWIPTSKLEALTEKLKMVSKGILIDANPSRRLGTQNQNVPVALRNPGLLGAFQMLVTTYGRPRYEEIDPTPLMLITFPLLFGAMFGDVGHGLLLTAVGWLVASKKIPSLRSMAGLGTIVVTCGLVATFFGFVYGSVFGFEDILHPLWLHPIEHILPTLEIAIGAGVFLISVGFVLNILNAIRARSLGRLIFDPNGIAGLVLYWSLLGFGAAAFLPNFPVPSSVFLVLAAAGAIGVMFSEFFQRLLEGHRPLLESGIGMFLFQSAVELFEKLISLLSNSLSYVRVGAFAVAHAGLSSAFFILAALVGPEGSVGYWIVVVIGNIFIVGFEGLIVGIQTMRLEYYEFFSKFFSGGGMPYEPLNPLPSGEKS